MFLTWVDEGRLTVIIHEVLSWVREWGSSALLITNNFVTVLLAKSADLSLWSKFHELYPCGSFPTIHKQRPASGRCIDQQRSTTFNWGGPEKGCNKPNDHGHTVASWTRVARASGVTARRQLASSYKRHLRIKAAAFPPRFIRGEATWWWSRKERWPRVEFGVRDLRLSKAGTTVGIPT
jgi:hypothetical protein